MTRSAQLSETQARKDAAVDWFLRRQAGELSLAEASDFERWLAASPANLDAFLAAETFWTGAAQAQEHPHFHSMRTEVLRDVGRRRLMRRSGTFAVAAMAAALLGSFGYQAIAPKPLVTQSFQTMVGQQAVVTLADGSTVTLNTDTVIRTKAHPDRRLVYLDKGQAFFRVAKDRRHPFVVTAAGQTVTALGTAFDLRVDRGSLKVLLVEGKVRVEGPGIPTPVRSATSTAKDAGPMPAPTRTTEMEPGSQLVALGDGDWRLTRVNVEHETSWLHGKIVFDDEALGDVVAELNRYSKRKIVIANESLGHARLSGIFEPGDVKDFAHALRLAGLAELKEDESGSLLIVPLDKKELRSR